MYEYKNKNNYKNLCFVVATALLVCVILGLFCRKYVVHGAELDTAEITTTEEIATNTDVDKTPYMTNDTAPLPLQTNDYLLSIRNVLVGIWGTIVLIWVYEKMRTIIFRLGGVKK